MTFSAGTRIGPYEIVSSLGSGGMGEVYLARNDRLAREVALKVLHEDVSADPARLKRFESEARSASALNHPNIVTIYDAGTSGAIAWIAMERVEGKTVREILATGALPTRRLLPIAIQIADGLARAHAAGIVHRDLKPENVMVTRDGLVKILDFGLAKLAPSGSDEAGGSRSPKETATFPGTVVGTIGYMSPEQAAGEPVDFRSDQFSFGSLLYEMTTGIRAFHGKSAVDTLAAVLKGDPTPVAEINPQAPVPLRWIIERCLAKDAARRYDSTRDLARDLETLRDRSSETAAMAAIRPARWRWLGFAALLAATAALAVVGGMLFVAKKFGDRPIPDFQRLTFRRGLVGSARFAPDGRTIVYSAEWDGAPSRLFSGRTDGRDSNRLELPEASLLSVSSLGELALSLSDTLARVPLTGGAPREMFEGVVDADWSPDGQNLAVIRHVDDGLRLEYPIGKVLYQPPGGDFFSMSSVRVSPDGRRIAFMVFHSTDSNASVDVVDLTGEHRVLSRRYKRATRLAWSPDGGEVWFNANERGWRTPLRAVTLKGVERLLMVLPSWIFLQDVARDGRVLATLSPQQARMWAMTPGETRERDISWHESSLAMDLTPDGKTLLFDEGAEGYFHAIYVRGMDGSPAKRIGEGRAMAISPDGRWVASNARERGSETVLLPTGAGAPLVLDSEGNQFSSAVFFPDGKRILLSQDEGASYVKELPAGRLQALAPGITRCGAISPDGKESVCAGPDGAFVRYSFDTGTYRPIPGLGEAGADPVKWAADGTSLFLAQLERPPMRILRFDLATGKTQLWRELELADQSSIAGASNFFAMTPDGRSYAYSSPGDLQNLYLITGLR